MLFRPRFARTFTLSLSLTCTCLFFAACTPSAAEIILTSNNPAYTGNIYVAGAVNNPGLYPFAASESLDDLVKAAGGLKAGTGLEGVILTIPDPASAATPQRININRADAWLLAALPGIGDTRAADIVAYRQASGPFRSINDLLKVSGIGPATLDKIKDYITVGG